jgi:hypothetical protein
MECHPDWFFFYERGMECHPNWYFFFSERGLECHPDWFFFSARGDGASSRLVLLL